MKAWMLTGVILLVVSPLASAESKDMKKLFDQIDEKREEHISFLRRLIQTSNQGEEAVQAVVAERFESLGCEVETLKLLPTQLSLKNEFAAEESIDMTERISVVGKLAGTGEGKSLLFFGHPDGEPVTAESKKDWTRDPFAAEIDKGRIYGWGVADDLSGVAIMAEALAAVVETLGPLEGDV